MPCGDALIAKAWAEAMEETGIKQDVFAAVLGTSQQNVSARIARGTICAELRTFLEHEATVKFVPVFLEHLYGKLDRRDIGRNPALRKLSARVSAAVADGMLEAFAQLRRGA